MNVIRHNDRRIQFNTRKTTRYIIPTFLNDFPGCIQPHFPILYLPKQTFTVPGADGYKIRPLLGIIVVVRLLLEFTLPLNNK